MGKDRASCDTLMHKSLRIRQFEARWGQDMDCFLSRDFLGAVQGREIRRGNSLCRACQGLGKQQSAEKFLAAWLSVHTD